MAYVFVKKKKAIRVQVRREALAIKI